MNRRHFLVRLGLAAAGAEATRLLEDDPERLIWTPGAKTIIDFGATKQVLPATDREVVANETARLIAQQLPLPTGESGAHAAVLQRAWLGESARLGLDDGPRDIRLDLASGGSLTSFHYRGDRLVSLHSPEELALLNKPLWPGRPGLAFMPEDLRSPEELALLNKPLWPGRPGLAFMPEDE